MMNRNFKRVAAALLSLLLLFSLVGCAESTTALTPQEEPAAQEAPAPEDVAEKPAPEEEPEEPASEEDAEEPAPEKAAEEPAPEEAAEEPEEPAPEEDAEEPAPEEAVEEPAPEEAAEEPEESVPAAALEEDVEITDSKESKRPPVRVKTAEEVAAERKEREERHKKE